MTYSWLSNCLSFPLPIPGVVAQVKKSSVVVMPINATTVEGSYSSFSCWRLGCWGTPSLEELVNDDAVSINSVSCAITRRSNKGRQTKSSMNTPPTTSHSSNLHRIPPQLCKQILVADVCKKFHHLQITNWLHSEEVKTFPLFGKQTSLVSPCNLSISLNMLCQSIKDLSDP